MKVRSMVRAALIAAVYATLCVILSPLSYGPVQVRLAEALTLLPVLCPEAVAGVTIGCFIANLLTGAPLDMIFGTAATFAAALLTYRLRNRRWRGLPVLSSLPPILINAVVVGILVTILYFPAGQPIAVWLINMLSVGTGQLISCGLLGLSLIWFIQRSPSLVRLFSDHPLSLNPDDR